MSKKKEQHLDRRQLALEATMATELLLSLSSEEDGRLVPLMLLRQEPDLGWKLLSSTGVVEGSLAVAFTFFGLNRMPRIVARRAARKLQQQQQQQPPYHPQQPNYKPNMPNPFHAASPKEQEHLRQRSARRWLYAATELTFDIGMSLAMGAMVAYVWTDEPKLRQTIAQVPLQPGRSPLSDAMCTPLLHEYQRQWLHPDPHRRQVLESPPFHPGMKTTLDFAANCRHRQVMEQQLRDPTDSNHHHAPMEIPATGVIPQSEDPLLMMMLERQHEQDEDVPLWNSNDVQSWVSDQNE